MAITAGPRLQDKGWLLRIRHDAVDAQATDTIKKALIGSKRLRLKEGDVAIAEPRAMESDRQVILTGTNHQHPGHRRAMAAPVIV